VVGGKPHGLLWAKVLRIHSLKGLLDPHDLAWCRAYSHSYSCAPPLVNTFVLLLCYFCATFVLLPGRGPPILAVAKVHPRGGGEASPPTEHSARRGGHLRMLLRGT
jgi:hypothetical protein